MKSNIRNFSKVSKLIDADYFQKLFEIGLYSKFLTWSTLRSLQTNGINGNTIRLACILCYSCSPVCYASF